MNPTLHETDLLEVMPCHGTILRVGDVALFVPEGAAQAVVHRVIATSPAGMRTQGDNNATADTWFLQPEGVVGRVTAAQRGDRRRIIHGGRRGLMAARLRRLRSSPVVRLACVLRPIYRMLIRRGTIARLLPSTFQPRVIQFSSGGQQRLRVTVGRRPIGCYDAEARAWRIKRWYRLLVDERSLPICQ